MLVFISHSFRIRNRILVALFLLINLSSFGCKAFLAHQNNNILSNFHIKNRNTSQIPLYNSNKIKCSNRISPLNSTHTTFNDPIETKYENVLALGCTESKKLAILKSICESVSENKSNLKRIVYLSSNDKILDEVYNFLDDPNSKVKPNLISSTKTRLHHGSFLILANSSKLLKFSDLLNKENEFEIAKGCMLNGKEIYEEDGAEEFRREIEHIIRCHFLSNIELSPDEWPESPQTVFDKKFLMPAKDWINTSYVEPEYIVDLIGKAENKDSLVFVDGFEMEYDVKTMESRHDFKDELLGKLRGNWAFLGVSTEFYNPQLPRDWLNSIFGPVEVVTMSKSPRFNLLTSLGSLEPFIDVDAHDTKLERVDMNNVGEISKYFTKKSNAIDLSSFNPELNDAIVGAITVGLKSKGIDTLHKLVRASSDVYGTIKKYYRKLRTNPEFINSDDKLQYLLKSLVDVGKNKRLSWLVNSLNLRDEINQLYRPTIDRLMPYIWEKGMFPTVIYKFNEDIEELIEEFYSYVPSYRRQILGGLSTEDLENLKPLGIHRLILAGFRVATLLESDNIEYVRYVSRNAHRFDVVITNTQIQGAPHYVLMDLFSKVGARRNLISNNQLYSYSMGADLVTFIMDITGLMHVLRGIISPLYMNLSHLVGGQGDVGGKRTFRSYLRRCRDEYSQKYPEYLVLMETHKRIKEGLESCNVDTEKLIRLIRDTERFKKQIKILEHSIHSKFYFRGKLAERISEGVGIGGSTVLGIDDERYRVKYIGKSPKRYIECKDPGLSEKLNLMCKEGPCVILENLNDGKLMLTETAFIKDILYFHTESAIEPNEIQVDSFKPIELELENDLKEHVNVNSVKIKCILINWKRSIITPKLSSVLPAEVRKRYFDDKKKYEDDLKQLEELMNKGQEKMSSEDCKIKLFGEDLVSVSKEYTKLDAKLRRLHLEHVIKNYRIKNRVWGK